MTRCSFLSGLWRFLAEIIRFSDRTNIEEWTDANHSSATSWFWPESKVSYFVSLFGSDCFSFFVFLGWNFHLSKRCIFILIDLTSRVVSNIRQSSSNSLLTFFVRPSCMCGHVLSIRKLRVICSFFSYLSRRHRSISFECTQWLIPIERIDKIFPLLRS